MSYPQKPNSFMDYALAFGAAALSLAPNAGCGKESLDQKVQPQATGLPVAEGSQLRGRLVVAPPETKQELDLSTPEKAVDTLVRSAMNGDRNTYEQAITPADRSNPEIIDMFNQLKAVSGYSRDKREGSKVILELDVDGKKRKAYFQVTSQDNKFFVVRAGPYR